MDQFENQDSGFFSQFTDADASSHADYVPFSDTCRNVACSGIILDSLPLIYNRDCHCNVPCTSIKQLSACFDDQYS